MRNITRELRIRYQTNQAMMIPEMIDEYKVLKMIMETENCVVVATTDPKSDEKVAIKCIPKDNVYIDSQELKVMTELSHPNIIRCLQSFYYPKENPRFFAIVMPFAHFDLANYIESKRMQTERKICKIIYDSLKAVDFMHKNKIWHRDLKPENIFVIEETPTFPFVVIGDFGNSAYFEKDVFEGPACGTLQFAAPELICVKKDPTTNNYTFGFKSNARCFFHSKKSIKN